MLSEICVRRPVFATMLVMSLVVLGTFSFRGLGVDLLGGDPPLLRVGLRKREGTPIADPDSWTPGRPSRW